jgi:hypothetical protein
LRLSRYKKGMRRKGAQQKGELGLSLAEGKKPLPIAAYKELARILFESEKPEHVAAHAFLILAWNLIARAEFVVDVKIDAIYFQNDAIMIDMGKTKTDQDGTKILITHGISTQTITVHTSVLFLLLHDTSSTTQSSCLANMISLKEQDSTID